MRDNNKNYYDESYRKYFKQRQFGILKKARDLNIHIHNLANKGQIADEFSKKQYINQLRLVFVILSVLCHNLLFHKTLK